MRAPFVFLIGIAAFLGAAEPARITVPLHLDRTAIALRPGPAPDGIAVAAERAGSGYSLTIQGVTQTIVAGGSVGVEVNGLPYILRDANGQWEWTRHYRVEGILKLGPCVEAIDLHDDARMRLGETFEFCGRLLTVDAVAANTASITFREVSKLKAQVGQPAPAVVLSTLDGSRVHLQQPRAKPLLLDFWASWCDICLGEFPALRQLHDSGVVEIVSINIDNAPYQAAAKTILQQQSPQWTQVMTGQGEGTSAWQVFEPLTYAGGMPLYVLIDITGVVRYAGTGGGTKLPEVQAELGK